MRQDVILEIKDLTISFRDAKDETVRIIRGVDLELPRGKTLAIVGESGSGKSLTVKSAMGLLPDNAYIEKGSIVFRPGDGSETDIAAMSKKKIISTINGSNIAMVFQDPLTILNPTMNIGAQVTEGMIKHGRISKNEAWDRAEELLDTVGIKNSGRVLHQYPHQLSGGMRQRVVIAIALACDPKLLICDEPTTALDVTVQARIIDTIKSIQAERDLSVLYITHDLGVVAEVADHVSVMYAGRIVESGTTEDIFFRPAHPYTWGLLSSVPSVGDFDDELYSIPGNPPDLSVEFKGDPFAVRNDMALDIDYEEEPPVFTLSDTHEVRSWLYDDKAPEVNMPEALQGRIRRMIEEANYAGL